MAVLKVIEVLANSNKSWEDATKKAVKHASKSVKNNIKPLTLISSQRSKTNKTCRIQNAIADK